MIKVRRIRYATFETPDLEKAVAYYTQVNGLTLVQRDKGRAFLATEIGELAVALEQGQQARCLGLSFEVAPNTDFAAVSRQLSDEGIQSEESCEPAPGIPRLLSFPDPNKTIVGLLSECSCVGELPASGRGRTIEAGACRLLCIRSEIHCDVLRAFPGV